MKVSFGNDNRIGKPGCEVHFSDSYNVSFSIEFWEHSVDVVDIVENNIAFSQPIFQLFYSLDLKHYFFLKKFLDLPNQIIFIILILFHRKLHHFNI